MVRSPSRPHLQPLATNIPSADSLKLTSRATVAPNDPPLPKPVVAESSLKRDDWMLEPPTTPAVSSSIPQKRALALADKSLTEDYGDPVRDSRTATGGVDFFSSLGTERQKKPKVDPTEVKTSIIHRVGSQLMGFTVATA